MVMQERPAERGEVGSEWKNH